MDLLIILVALITLYIFQNKKKKDASTSNIVKVKKKTTIYCQSNLIQIYS